MNTQQVKFFNKAYFWMGLGLAISALVALVVASSRFLLSVLFSPLIFILFIFELVLVVILSFNLQKLKVSTARALFIVYSFLNGLTLSVIFMAYTSLSIASVFFITAIMFVALGFLGAVTKKDLGPMGKFFFMALIGLILVSIINLFWRNSTFELVISLIGVFIFAGLTVYDHYWMKKFSVSLRRENIERFAIFAALKLYLDFINMFLLLLRLFGKRKVE